MFDTGGWLYPVLLSVGLIVVCTAMELLSVAITEKAARTVGNPSQSFTAGQKAA